MSMALLRNALNQFHDQPNTLLGPRENVFVKYVVYFCIYALYPVLFPSITMTESKK